MSTAIPCTECSSISNFPSIGFGIDFSRLKKYYDREINELRKAETLGRLDEVLQALDEIFEECSEEGWDGYDARPISEAVYIEARRFIDCLPLASFIPMPEIIPEPTGEIAFEWSREKRQIFVASVRGENEIVYAGLFGSDKDYGTKYFGEYLPPRIIQYIIELYS